jgi:cation diffusion facilitator CzcD-associated flavoprotein CzcO
VRVAIIGGGLSGIGAAIMLRRDGIDDAVVLERGSEPGGTWRDNTYPGCACDVPSMIYSFSFAPNPDWSRLYAPQAEIRAYVLDVLKRHDVERQIHTDTDVLEAAWDGEAQRWQIETTRGRYTAQAVISATGPWSEPIIPDLPGLETFAGKIFHSSRWDHDHPLEGAHVAVVGTGASAVQFVPQIQPRAASVTIFQRTAQWVMPKLDRPLTHAERALFRRFPIAQRALREALYHLFELVGVAQRKLWPMRVIQRVAQRQLRRTVRDPELRRALTPDHTLGCKRILMSNEWYGSLTRPNVRVVPHAVQEIRPHGVVGADGIERPADTLILGTGFTITDLPIASRVRGRDGRTLADVWQGGPQAHLGTTVSGFPNFFLMLGPNIGNGHSSAILLAETQIGYAIDALKALELHGASSADVRPEVQEAFNAEVQRRLVGTVWNAGGCASYYMDATGRNSAIFPGSTIELRRRLRRFEPSEHELTRPG